MPGYIKCDIINYSYWADNSCEPVPEQVDGEDRGETCVHT
jgi:hypothetical protein